MPQGSNYIKDTKKCMVKTFLKIFIREREREREKSGIQMAIMHETTQNLEESQSCGLYENGRLATFKCREPSETNARLSVRYYESVD